MPFLELRGITHRFGVVPALEDVDLDVLAGEVHALLGANGAGKSTLMNVLAGGLVPDRGEVHVDGRPVGFRSPADAARAGIGMVHQHDALVGPFAVAENLALGLPGAPSWLGRRRLLEAYRTAAATSPLPLPAADARVDALGVGERQRVEIARALADGGRALVLDEPTAVLTPDEAEALLRAVRGLASAGWAVVFITHRLGEVAQVADRVTVLRSGRVVLGARRDDGGAAPFDRAALTAAMVGADPPDDGNGPAARSPRPGAEEVLTLRGVSVRPLGTSSGLVDVDLAVRRGEIVGVAGVDGNGQRALAAVVAGRRAPEEGEVRIAGRVPRPFGTAACRDLGLAVVPEDRRVEGLALDLSIAENVLLSVGATGRRGLFPLGPRRIVERAAPLLERFQVTADPRDPARSLSGGNQQRVVLARELATTPAALLLVNPTRGLDLKAAAFVRREVARLRDAGTGVLLVSTDLDEVLATSDRIVVLSRGRVAGRFERGATRAEVGPAMAGEPAA